MNTIILSVAILMLASFIFTGGFCSSGNLEYCKKNACEKWRSVGFECVGYEGYQWAFWGKFGSKYGGAIVWHTLKRIPDNGVIYGGFVQRWGDELHVYSLKPYDGFRIPSLK